MNSYKFLELARGVHGFKYKYIDLPNKLTYKDYIKIELGGSEFLQRVNRHLSGKCPEKTTLRKTNEDFINESIKIWGDRFDYSDCNYIGALKKVKLFDKELGIFINQLPTLHLSGHASKNITNDIFIEMSKIVSDYKYQYNNCNYINKTTKVIITCQLHSDFLVLPFNHLNYGDQCPHCNESKGEKEITKFLNKYKITYDRQHKFPDCKNIYQLPFDFYIPPIRTCIEFDGIQHFQPITHFGGLLKYNQLKINDKIKSDYCEDNYISLIRIRYDQIEDIYRILWDNLKTHIKTKKTS